MSSDAYSTLRRLGHNPGAALAALIGATALPAGSKSVPSNTAWKLDDSLAEAHTLLGRVETMWSTMCAASRPTPPNSAELSE
jgi:hypothetical protein